jgi:hypothetical protein
MEINTKIFENKKRTADAKKKLKEPPLINLFMNLYSNRQTLST